MVFRARPTSKGRCANCWGGLIGRLDDAHRVTGIKCRVCDEKLEGDAARDEYARMQNESATNMVNLDLGWLPRYADDATFLQKVLPIREPLSEEDLARAIAQAKANPIKEKPTITRHDFPPGSPGFFFLQATILMASVEGLSHPDAWSITDLPDVRLRDDGSAVFTLSTGGISDDPQYQERRLTRRLGQTMTATMISAFACELVMKAITLTADHEAIKTHDLLDLFRDLPEPSRLRIVADYPEIETVLDAGRQTFDAWRYFEASNSETTAQVMINIEHGRHLGKAVRVILDEAVMMGLGFSVNVDAKQRVRVGGDRELHHLDLKLNVKGREAPPHHDSSPKSLPN